MRGFLRLSCYALFIACVASTIAACDGGKKAPPPDLLKGQRQSMERAKDVEKTLQQSSDRRREEVDRGGQ